MKHGVQQSAVDAMTPSELRALRLFRSVPEESRPKFFEILELICTSCKWDRAGDHSLQVVQQREGE